MPLPTTFFHAARRMRQLQREHARRPSGTSAVHAASLASEVDGMIVIRLDQIAPEEPLLLAAAKRCRDAQRSYVASNTYDALIVAQATEDELDAAIASIERQSAREQSRQAAEPQMDLFTGARR